MRAQSQSAPLPVSFCATASAATARASCGDNVRCHRRARERVAVGARQRRHRVEAAAEGAPFWAGRARGRHGQARGRRGPVRGRRPGARPTQEEHSEQHSNWWRPLQKSRREWSCYATPGERRRRFEVSVGSGRCTEFLLPSACTQASVLAARAAAQSFDPARPYATTSTLVVPNRMTRRRRPFSPCASPRAPMVCSLTWSSKLRRATARIRGASSVACDAPRAGPSTPPAPAIPPRRARTAVPTSSRWISRTGTRRPRPRFRGARARASRGARARARPASCAWAESSAPVAIPSRRRHCGGGGGAAFSRRRASTRRPSPSWGRRRPARRCPRRRRRRPPPRARRRRRGRRRLDEEEGVQCAICHGTSGRCRSRSCAAEHPFCTGCILNWALQKKKCPLCVTPFTHLWLYKQLTARSTTTSTRRMSTSSLRHLVQEEVASSSAANDSDSGDEYHDSCSTSTAAAARRRTRPSSTSTCRKRSRSGAAAAAPSATGCGAQAASLRRQARRPRHAGGAAVDAEGEGEVGGARRRREPAGSSGSGTAPPAEGGGQG